MISKDCLMRISIGGGCWFEHNNTIAQEYWDFINWYSNDIGWVLNCNSLMTGLFLMQIMSSPNYFPVKSLYYLYGISNQVIVGTIITNYSNLSLESNKYQA